MSIIKKSFLLGLILIIFSISVFATITIDPIAKTTFNYGDKLVVSGNVIIEQDARAFLAISLSCGGSKKTLSTTFMDLKNGVNSGFSNLVSMPSLPGTCRIEARLTSNGDDLETKESPEFSVTGNLKSNFDVSVKSNSQLGDSFVINGAVLKQDGAVVDGSAVINFKEGGNLVFFEDADIKSGEFSYRKDLSLIPAGDYSIDVEVKDNLGNSGYYSDVTTFSVLDKLGIDARIDKNLYDPSEALSLSGEVKSLINSVVENIDVEVEIEGVKLMDSLPDAKFPFNIKYSIPSNIKRGEHIIKITVKDDKGNYGTTSLKFSVRAVPKTLNFFLNKSSVIPLENIIFKVVLLDQANDVIEDQVFVKLYNEKGEFEKSKVVGTNGYDFLITPYMGLPGNWRIVAEGFGLVNEKTLVVLPYKNVVTDVKEGKLIVQNTGNVVYEDFIDVKSGDKIKGRKIYLDLNESTSIPLDDLFDPGVYELNVPFTGQNFSSVTVYEQGGLFSGLAGITGNAVANLQDSGKKLWLFVLFLGLLVALILVLKPYRKREVYSDSDRSRDYIAGQKKLAELQAKGIRKGPSMQFGKADEKDVADFRDRMSRQVEEEQRRQAKTDFSNRWNNDRGNSGSSGMGGSSSGGLINW